MDDAVACLGSPKGSKNGAPKDLKARRNLSKTATEIHFTPPFLATRCHGTGNGDQNNEPDAFCHHRRNNSSNYNTVWMEILSKISLLLTSSEIGSPSEPSP